MRRKHRYLLYELTKRCQYIRVIVGEISRTPVIVLTAIAPLAAPEGIPFSAYVRLDSSTLLASHERAIRCVQEVFTLFLRGEVSRAITTAKWRERSELLWTLGGYVVGALRSIWSVVAERDVSVSVFEGRFELKRSGE